MECGMDGCDGEKVKREVSGFLWGCMKINGCEGTRDGNAMKQRDVAIAADGAEGDGHETAVGSLYIMINIDIRRAISCNSTKYIYCL